MHGNREIVWVKKCKEAWNKTQELGREDRKAWKKKSLNTIAGVYNRQKD